VDASLFTDTPALIYFCEQLVRGGATLLQYRNKTSTARVMLEQARQVKRAFGKHAKLMMNDRADLCLEAEFDGVHVGQDDLSPQAVRQLLGPELWLGISTHNPEQLAFADQLPVDYVAIGPVFPTSSKDRPDPVVGLEGVRTVRQLTRKPLIAIGGITRNNCGQVVSSGANSVAVISDLLPDPCKSAEEFFRVLR
jgi:thiamine-phosphate pyrophosphorylase